MECNTRLFFSLALFSDQESLSGGQVPGEEQFAFGTCEEILDGQKTPGNIRGVALVLHKNDPPGNNAVSRFHQGAGNGLVDININVADSDVSDFRREFIIDDIAFY